MIWGFPKPQLGDRWSHLNRVIKFSKNNIGNIFFENNTEEEIGKIRNLWDLIDTNVKLNIIYQSNDFHPADGVVEFPYPYYKTKEQWLSNTEKEYDICFQIKTSASSAEWLPIKNFTSKNFEDFEKKIRSKYKIIELGQDKNTPIKNEINIMLKSKVFVGISSGFAHIAHSVGIPVFLKNFENDDNNIIKPELQWVKFIENFHPNKHFSLFSSIDELIFKLNLFKKYNNNTIDWKLCPIFQKAFSERNPFNNS
jgi:hypothetical protein